jgi:16S rRNA (cytidine1402-2'-O)-methyltransferase
MKKLYLLPNLLHEASSWSYTPGHLDALIAESEKGGWTFLKKFSLPQVPIYLLNEHTKDVEALVKIPQEIVGLISDAGLPCLADPGAALVAAAHRQNIVVEAVPGPCSITMALQLSGLSGQAFAFHGYFPREEKELMAKIKGLATDLTHLFIETPYRTDKIFQRLLNILKPNDRLCVALELMSPDEKVQTRTISEWKHRPALIGKRRAVFVIQKGL